MILRLSRSRVMENYREDRGLPDVLYECGVSVAQFSLSSDNRFLGRGEVGGAKRLPLLHALCWLVPATPLVLGAYIPARSVV
jgi:hypothetical protein